MLCRKKSFVIPIQLRVNMNYGNTQKWLQEIQHRQTI